MPGDPAAESAAPRDPAAGWAATAATDEQVQRLVVTFERLGSGPAPHPQRAPGRSTAGGQRAGASGPRAHTWPSRPVAHRARPTLSSRPSRRTEP